MIELNRDFGSVSIDFDRWSFVYQLLVFNYIS